MMKFMDGYKSYIGLIAGGVWGIVAAQGWVAEATIAMGWSAIAAFTGVSLKHAWSKSVKK